MPWRRSASGPVSIRPHGLRGGAADQEPLHQVAAVGLDPGEILRVVQEREQVLSTGIGNGVALPHGKSDACSELAIAAGVTRDPIEFDALDAEPVRLVFLLVGPESAAGAHVKALSRISRMVRQPPVRQRLMDATDAGSFLEVLREADAA